MSSHNAKQGVVLSFRLGFHTVTDSQGVALMQSQDLFFICPMREELNLMVQRIPLVS